MAALSASLVPPTGLDRRVMQFLADHRRPRLTSIARQAQAVGDPRIIAIAGIAVLVVIVLSRRWATGLALGAATVLAEDVSVALKHLFGRPRPPYQLALTHPSGFSFPSGAAMLTMAPVLVVVLMECWPSRHWRWPGAIAGSVIVGGVGWAVMYLGAHWLTDVLAGWLLAALIAAGCSAVAPQVVRVATAWIGARRGRADGDAGLNGVSRSRA